MKSLGEEFKDIQNPTDCVAKCDEARGKEESDCWCGETIFQISLFHTILGSHPDHSV